MKNSKAILQVPGTMKIISAEIPVPKEDEVLIKVEYVGICGSDVHGFESGPFIPPKDPNQEIGLGHECAGTVVAVGSRVRKFKPGDRVNIEPGVPCGHCRYCLEGKYNICPDVDFMATQPNYRGALTHYLCHPESFTYKLPDNMDTMEGALVEPAAVGMHAAMLADVKPGKKIIILGAGCIGLMTLQACKCLGATEIAVVDVLEGDVDVVEHLRFTGDDVDEGVVQIVGVQVVQANPVKGQLAQLGEQLPQHPLVVEVDAVAGDVLGNDDELLHPGIGQGLGLRQQGLHGTAAVAAPQLGNDTEGAPVVAALGDLQVGGVGGGGGDARPVLLRVVDIPEAVGRAPGHQLLQGGDDLGVAAGAHDAVHLGQLLHQLVLIALGQAACPASPPFSARPAPGYSEWPRSWRSR